MDVLSFLPIFILRSFLLITARDVPNRHPLARANLTSALEGGSISTARKFPPTKRPTSPRAGALFIRLLAAEEAVVMLADDLGGEELEQVEGGDRQSNPIETCFGGKPREIEKGSQTRYPHQCQDISY
jgi:hypothetical protein